VTFGAALFSLTIGVMAILGVYQITGSNGWYTMPATIPGFLLGAVLEEVAIRGVVFRILEQWLGSWIALALSAVLFGLLHLLNPGVTLLNAGAVMLEAGILLAAAYMLTRRLWLCIGIHFAWNFTQGGIFSAAVSGGPPVTTTSRKALLEQLTLWLRHLPFPMRQKIYGRYRTFWRDTWQCQRFLSIDLR
jgi:membrane protease YdiL (CAAX protease family)